MAYKGNTITSKEEGRQALGKNHQHLEGAHVCSPASAMPAPVCFFFFFFSDDNLQLDMQPTLKSSVFPSEIALGKTKFSFAHGYPLETASDLGMGEMYSLLLILGPFLCKPMQTYCLSSCEFG